MNVILVFFLSFLSLLTTNVGYASSGEICGDGLDNNFDAQIDEGCNRVNNPVSQGTFSEDSHDRLYDSYISQKFSTSSSPQNLENFSDSTGSRNLHGLTPEAWLESTNESSGYESGAKQNQLVDAGPDQDVVEGANVSLMGKYNGSTNNTLVNFQWQQVGGSHNVTLNNTTSHVLNFTAPSIGAGLDVLGFELTVTDNRGNKQRDGVEVLVKSDG